MSTGIFTDKARKPDAKGIEKAVGRSAKSWNELNEFLAATLKLKAELKFYGVNYGWALRYAKSGKSVIALYPGEDGFTAQIILKREQVKSALEHHLSAATKDAVNRAHEFNEGRWVYLKLDEGSKIDDVKSLVSARVYTK